MQVASNVNRILAREKHNDDSTTLERKLTLGTEGKFFWPWRDLNRLSCSLRSRRYCLGERLKSCRQSRDPKKGVGTTHKKIPAATQASCLAKKRVPKRFLGIRDFPYLTLGIRDFKAKSSRDSGLTVCAGRSWGVGCQKTLGITGLKNPFGNFLRMRACFSLWVSITDPPSLSVFGIFILTQILFGHFLILLPYKGAELVHTYSCYTVGF